MAKIDKGPSAALLLNRYAACTLGCILLQQTVVASATYLLTQLMFAYQQGGRIDYWLYAYLAAMFFPYLPGCLGDVALQKWTNTSHADYVTAIIKHLRKQRRSINSDSGRTFQETLLSKQSFSSLSSFLGFVHALADMFASSVFNIIVLALLLPGDLAIGYTISAVLSVLLILGTQGLVSRLADREERRLIDYSAHLGRAWDNVTLGNGYNWQNWRSGEQIASSAYYDAAMRLQWVSSISGMLLSAATLLPTIYLVQMALTQDVPPTVVAAALIANLTRIFHVLSGLNGLVEQTIRWSATWARLKVLFDGWTVDATINSPSSIVEGLSHDKQSMPPLSINGIEVVSRTDSIAQLKNQHAGRFTIRGPNGAGKSTFLKMLKHALGEQGFYLPAHASGLCWRTPIEGLSTGQRMQAFLAEVEAIDNVSHFLLDEWDANLDTQNTAAIDQRLSALAAHRVVIEVRH